MVSAILLSFARKVVDSFVNLLLPPSYRSTALNSLGDGCRDVIIVCGGADGVAAPIKSRPPWLASNILGCWLCPLFWLVSS
jgi:hypothetical protein